MSSLDGKVTCEFSGRSDSPRRGAYRLDLFGEIAYQGDPLVDETYEAVASAFAPLPMFGLDAIFAVIGVELAP